MVVLESFTHFDICLLDVKEKDEKLVKDTNIQDKKLRILHFKNAKFLDILYRATKVDLFKHDKCLIGDILIFLRPIEIHRRSDKTMDHDIGSGFDELINFIINEFAQDIKEADEKFTKNNLYNALTIERVFTDSSICVKSIYTKSIDDNDQMNKNELIFNAYASSYLLIESGYEMSGKMFQKLCYVLTVEQIGIKNGRLTKLRKKVMIPFGKNTSEYNDIANLLIVPVERIREDIAESIKNRMENRRQIFSAIYPELKSVQYKGYGWTIDRWSYLTDLNTDHMIKMEHSIIVDSEYFQKSNKSFSEKSSMFGDFKNLFDMGPSEQKIEDDPSVVTMVHVDESFLKSKHMMCCVPLINAYNPTLGKWVIVFADNVILNTDGSRDRNCLKNLIIPSINTRMMVKIIGDYVNSTGSKISTQSLHEQTDAILTSGNGNRTFLLHGPPGTGKTLTATLIGRYFKTPVFNIKIGDIYGGRADSFETNLEEQFELAKRWNAIIIIDEADVLMRKRTIEESMSDNVIVAVFLKKIETYSGVMFLTTNDISSIDLAFLSRMTLIIKYENPKPHHRKKMCDIIANELNLDLSPETLAHVWDRQHMSSEVSSGRDILNILRNFKAIKSSSTKHTEIDSVLDDDNRCNETDADVLDFLVRSVRMSL